MRVMKPSLDLAPAAPSYTLDGPEAEEILRIMRHRERMYRVFVCACAVICVLLLLVFWCNWQR